MINLQAIKDWIKVLEHANSLEKKSPLVRLSSIESSCGSPGCLVGWSYQLIENLGEDTYDFSQCCDELMAKLGIGDENSSIDFSHEFTQAWKSCHPGHTEYVFSGACAYTGEKQYEADPMQRNTVELSTIVQCWKQFIEYLEAQAAYQVVIG